MPRALYCDFDQGTGKETRSVYWASYISWNNRSGGPKAIILSIAEAKKLAGRDAELYGQCLTQEELSLSKRLADFRVLAN